MRSLLLCRKAGSGGRGGQATSREGEGGREGEERRRWSEEWSDEKAGGLEGVEDVVG